VFWALNENNFNPRILYPAVFHNKQKLKLHMTTKPPLQKILQGIIHTKDEVNKTIIRWVVLNSRRRKDK
jgi:hypothetical protein